MSWRTGCCGSGAAARESAQMGTGDAGCAHGFALLSGLWPSCRSGLPDTGSGVSRCLQASAARMAILPACFLVLGKVYIYSNMGVEGESRGEPRCRCTTMVVQKARMQSSGTGVGQVYTCMAQSAAAVAILPHEGIRPLSSPGQGWWHVPDASVCTPTQLTYTAVCLTRMKSRLLWAQTMRLLSSFWIDVSM